MHTKRWVRDDCAPAASRVSECQQRRWFAVQAQPNRENVAVRELANQGFTPFFPRRLKSRRHARKIDTVHAPFFPGYLFVSLDLGCDRWRSVNGTIGVSRIVAFADIPAPVPQGVVEALIECCDEQGLVRFEESFKVGQTVRVLAGPFAEFVGTLDRLDANGRVRVLLQIMGGRMSVALPRDFVSA